MDCGEPVFVILQADGAALNMDWFKSSGANASQNRSFTVLEQGMTASIGTHEHVIRAYFSRAPNNYIESETFTVEIIDPCDNPVL